MSSLMKYNPFFGRKLCIGLPAKGVFFLLFCYSGLGSSCQQPTSKTPSYKHPLQELFFSNSPQETPALVYTFNLDTVQLDLIAGNKRPLRQILKDSAHKSYQLLMNAGMFHSNGSPVGLFYNAQWQTTLNEDTTSKGNFFLQPNGVFYITQQQQAGILTTAQFQQQSPNLTLQLATQSGPMLLLEGHYHPAFNPSSHSKYIRNGVGINPDGTVVFILSLQPVNFHTFASFFLEKGCVNALYLDGAISGLYHQQGGSSEGSSKQSYGPVLGVLPKR